MAYFRICPNCGSHLDPGERCDCLEDVVKRVAAVKIKNSYITAKPNHFPKSDISSRRKPLININ